MDLLDDPAVAVGISERRERVVVSPVRIGPGRLHTVDEVVQFSDLDAAACQLGARGVYVRHDQMNALERPA